MARTKHIGTMASGKRPTQSLASSAPSPSMPADYQPSSFLFVKRPRLESIIATSPSDPYHLPVPLPKRRRPSNATAGPSRLPSPPQPSTPQAGPSASTLTSLGSPFTESELTASLPARAVQFKNPLEESTPLHVQGQLEAGSSPALVSEEPLFLAETSTEAGTEAPTSTSAILDINPPAPSPGPPPPLRMETYPRQHSPAPPSPLPFISCLQTGSTKSTSPPSVAPPPAETPRSSPMPPFPPTPGSESFSFGSPKWPLVRPRSPSTASDSDDEIDQLDAESMDVDPLAPPVEILKNGPEEDDLEKGIGQGGDGEDGSWKQKFDLMSRDLDEFTKGTRGRGKRRWEQRESLLHGLLEAEMMIGQSIDQMRDCLLRYKAAGYPIDNDDVL